MPERTLVAAQVSQKRRAERKLQTELASEIRVCEKTIRNLEKCEANSRLTTLKRLAASLHIPVHVLLRATAFPISGLPAKYEKIDAQDISAEIAVLSLWLEVFLCFSGESQLAFSDHCGICLDTVSRLLRKLPSCNPILSTVQKLAAYMSITASELLDTTLSKTDMERLLKERFDPLRTNYPVHYFKDS